MVTKRKLEKRRARKERNRAKDQLTKQQAWDSGRLILENHNKSSYSSEFTIRLSERIYSNLSDIVSNSLSERDFILSWRDIKSAVRDLVIYWSPDVPESGRIWEILLRTSELYWDGCDCILETLRREFYD